MGNTKVHLEVAQAQKALEIFNKRYLTEYDIENREGFRFYRLVDKNNGEDLTGWIECENLVIWFDGWLTLEQRHMRNIRALTEARPTEVQPLKRRVP